MKIYTSYFGNWRKWPKDAVVVSIARKKPLFWRGLEYKDLAPEEKMLRAWRNGELTKIAFEDWFEEQLGKLDKWDVKRDMALIGDGHDVILVCYEKPDEFCHRHIVAKWLGAEEFV